MEAALVIDTCGAEGYVAVVPVGKSEPPALSERRLGVRATQEELLPAVGAVLIEAGLILQDLKAVAVVHGPGSFTGVRIGLSAAKGLCEAAGLPLVTLSRLQVLAAAAGREPIWAWLQAGRGDVYAARFAQEEQPMCGEPSGDLPDSEAMEKRQTGAKVFTLQQAVKAAGSDAVAICEQELRTAAPGALFVGSADLEKALRAAAVQGVRNTCWSDVALSDALYLRVPDAELALRARQGLSQG